MDPILVLPFSENMVVNDWRENFQRETVIPFLSLRPDSKRGLITVIFNKKNKQVFDNSNKGLKDL
jgi:hypothetical protein